MIFQSIVQYAAVLTSTRNINMHNIWVQIVLWGMILANICMLEEVFEDEMKIDSGLSVEM